MTLDELKEKYVVILLREPMSHMGKSITSVTGTFGGGTLPGFFVLNQVQNAYDEAGTDIASEVDLVGKAIMGRSENIQSIVTGAGPS